MTMRSAATAAAMALALACGAPETGIPPQDDDADTARGNDARAVADGEREASGAPAEASGPTVRRTVYVPVYSHIFFRDERTTIQLAATLSIRNTDSKERITVTSVRYYDTEGRLQRRYVEKPLRLGPMASTDFVVEEEDTTGGSGANFIVEWEAERPVTEPVIEAVMISTRAGLGISFTSVGRVLERR